MSFQHALFIFQGEKAILITGYRSGTSSGEERNNDGNAAEACLADATFLIILQKLHMLRNSARPISTMF